MTDVVRLPEQLPPDVLDVVVAQEMHRSGEREKRARLYVEDGLRYCRAHRCWHKLDEFGRDSSRDPEQITTACRIALLYARDARRARARRRIRWGT